MLAASATQRKKNKWRRLRSRLTTRRNPRQQTPAQTHSFTSSAVASTRRRFSSSLINEESLSGRFMRGRNELARRTKRSEDDASEIIFADVNDGTSAPGMGMLTIIHICTDGTKTAMTATTSHLKMKLVHFTGKCQQMQDDYNLTILDGLEKKKKKERTYCVPSSSSNF